MTSSAIVAFQPTDYIQQLRIGVAEVKRTMLVAALVAAVSISTAACSGTSTATPEAQTEVQSQQQKDDQTEKADNKLASELENMEEQKFYWIEYETPSSWELISSDDSARMYRPGRNGLAQLSHNGGIDFADDGSEEVDYLLSGLDGDTTHVVSEKRKGSKGNAVTYTVDIERSEDGDLYKGYAHFYISGHGLTMFFAVVPEDDFDAGYDEVLQHIMDSIGQEPSYPPMGADDQGGLQTDDSASPINGETSPAQQTITEGTYRVGTDIEAGEYKLTSDAGTSGYWQVTNSSAPDADIVGNDNFEGSAYVTVTDGQYLKLNRCTAEKV